MFDLLKELFLNKCKFFTCDNGKFKGVYIVNIWMIGKDLMKHCY